jgi:hypothetical protein
MSRAELVISASLIFLTTLGGCGLSVPDKHPLSENTKLRGDYSQYGTLENTIVGHIRCEIGKGIWEVAQSKLENVAWLYNANWGTAVTLTLTFEDQTSANPGVSFLTPLENSVKAFPVGGSVTSSQSISIGLGVSGSANATRTETIQFTYTNKDLLYWANKQFAADPKAWTSPEACETNKGVTISSDLKIDQFIYDKATIASLHNVIGQTSRQNWPPFNTFLEQITFVATYGGSVTPTWKFARVAANPSSTTLSATRTNTDSVTITLGEVTPATATSPALLKSAGQNINNSANNGLFNGTNMKSQSTSN